MPRGPVVTGVQTCALPIWSAEGGNGRHFWWRLGADLLAANLLVANVWLQQVGWERIDLTEGNLYSISDNTRSYLNKLPEPLLIRGHFSAETHPLMAPLVPRMRDLTEEQDRPRPRPNTRHQCAS